MKAISKPRASIQVVGDGQERRIRPTPKHSAATAIATLRAAGPWTIAELTRPNSSVIAACTTKIEKMERPVLVLGAGYMGELLDGGRGTGDGGRGTGDG